MCSGITSASTASRFFAEQPRLVESSDGWTGIDRRRVSLRWCWRVSCCCVAVINLRGVGESVKANVVLTWSSSSGLLIVILVGFFAFGQGKGDFSRVVMFDTPGDKNVFLAVTAGTSLAFFAMVGFEDSVNMAEETKDPTRDLPEGHAHRPRASPG